MDSIFSEAGAEIFLMEKAVNEPSQKWEEVKMDGDWMKLKKPGKGLFLHTSEDGKRLTVEEEYSKGMLHFI